MEDKESCMPPDGQSDSRGESSETEHSSAGRQESAPEDAAAETPKLPPWMVFLIRKKEQREMEENKNREDDEKN